MMIPETIYLHYLSSLLEGEKKTCLSIVNQLIEKHYDVKAIYTDIIQKSMYRVGQLWDKCRLTIAEEHIATEITKDVLSLINLRSEQKQSTGNSIILTCVHKEQHELGAHLISDFFEYKGWNSYFIGANTPDSELIRLIDEKKPQLVGLSNNFYMNVTKLFELLDKIKEKFPDQKIIIGGQAPQNCHIEMIAKYPSVNYISTLDEVENYLAEHYPD